MLVKDKQFYKSFLLLCLPIVLQNVIALSVNLADNIMLGSYSEAALSGATAVNQIQFIYQNILMGIGDSMVILASQYWGKRDTAAMKKIASVAMRAGLIVMVVLFAVMSLFPARVMGLFNSDAAIISEGVNYVSIIRFTYPFFCVSTLLLAALRSTEVVGIAFATSLSALVVNCCINWCLIFGNLGFPEMGVRGAAIGTLISRIVEMTLILLFIGLKEKNLGLKLRDFLHLDRQMVRDYFRVGSPIIFLQCLWGVNNALQTVILGHMTSSAISANSMASNLFQIVKTVAVGAASTANVIIGKTIGQGDMKRVREYSKTLQILFLGIGVCCSILLFGLTEPVLSLYSLSDESRELARTFLHILCVVMLGMSYQMPVNSGIIKGGGDTRYVMKLDLTSIWGIVVPLSFIMAFVVKASPVVVVWCLNLDQLFKCVPAFIKVNYGHWVKKLTR